MSDNYAVRRILVPLDGSEYGERALPWAGAIGGESADLILLEVVPSNAGVRDFTGKVVATAEQIAKGYQDLATKQLGDVRSRWFPNRENVTLVIAEGDPTEQILAAAAQHNADMIVMSSRGRGAIGRFASGSVADRVVRHAPLPVCVIGPEGEIDAEVAVKRVLAPVDSAPLSLGALPVAAAIAVANGVEAHAVHVLSPAVDDMIVPLSGMQPLPASYSDDILKAREDEGRQVVDQAAARLKMLGADAVGDLYTGRPAEALTEILHAGDVLVLASHGRKGLPRWVLGSTALRLIQNGSAPVVVVTREYLESVSGE
ncbi:MAG: universal stress protein [Thermomicrobiales bacterium]|nr:universal stress protein [Thermomicrobiales bacterium]